jgi:hypothetical protein
MRTQSCDSNKVTQEYREKKIHLELQRPTNPSDSHINGETKIRQKAGLDGSSPNEAERANGEYP